VRIWTTLVVKLAIITAIRILPIKEDEDFSPGFYPNTTLKNQFGPAGMVFIDEFHRLFLFKAEYK
jgi:hypothetical protein